MVSIKSLFHMWCRSCCYSVPCLCFNITRKRITVCSSSEIEKQHFIKPNCPLGWYWIHFFIWKCTLDWYWILCMEKKFLIKISGLKQTFWGQCGCQFYVSETHMLIKENHFYWRLKSQTLQVVAGISADAFLCTKKKKLTRLKYFRQNI